MFCYQKDKEKSPPPPFSAREVFVVERRMYQKGICIRPKFVYERLSVLKRSAREMSVLEGCLY